MKMTWMTVDFRALGEMESLSKWWISSPTPVDTAEDQLYRTKACEKLVLGPNVSALTFAFCSTFPLVAMMEAGLGFSTDAELMGEAASVLL